MELKGREYKLLLNPRKFKTAPSVAMATKFWRKVIMPIAGESRCKETLDKQVERRIRFWDFAGCPLTHAGLALRSRLEGDELPELTLKLRHPDPFVVAAADLAGGIAEQTFEEDIAPLEIQVPKKTKVIVPEKLSTRSRFALSAEHATAWEAADRTAETIKRLFPNLETFLGKPLIGELTGGPEITEFCWKNAKVTLSGKLDAKFSLTLWFIDGHTDRPAIAEISFKCDAPNGILPGPTAQAAYDLFIRLQAELGKWLNAESSSKTELVLPRTCRR